MSTLEAARYVPDFELEVGGRPFPTAMRAGVMSVRFEEGLEGAGRVDLTLADRDLRFLDDGLLELDAPLELAVGYRPAPLMSLFSGTITGVESTLPTSGLPTMTVSAQDATNRLTEGTKQRGFPFYFTDGVIATIVAAENGLLAIPDAAAQLITGLGVFNQRPRFQHKQSDYQFLHQIAAEYGFDVWVEGQFLNFRRLVAGLPAPEIELRWGQSLLEFAPRLSTVGQVASVEIKVWLETIKTQLSVQAGWDGERIRARVRPAVCGQQAGTVEASLTLPDVPLDTPVDAIKFVLGELRRRVNTRITATGSAVGDPRFRVGRVVSIANVGRRFSSDVYRLTSVVHTVGSNGYQTGFRVRKEII